MTGTDALSRLLPSLVVLGGVLVALRWYLRRQGGGGQQLVRVLSRTGVSRGALLAVVQTGERRLLLGVTDHQINLLAELPRDAALDLTEQVQITESPVATDATGLAAALRGTQGPRMGFVDRLRDMTVRTTPPRPPRARS